MIGSSQFGRNTNKTPGFQKLTIQSDITGVVRGRRTVSERALVLEDTTSKRIVVYSE
jgi:hypothetical protein